MKTEPIGYGVRRMCVACDLEHYSPRPDSGQIEAQRAMTGLLTEAGGRGALERAQWLTQALGDGELALLPPGVDEARVITSLWRELREGLHRYNRYANEAARLRMRIAVHEGQTYIADNGFAGDAINTVCRLCDCAEIKDALSVTASDLVLIVSDRIFDDVIRGYDAHDLPAFRLHRGHRDHARQRLPVQGVHFQRSSRIHAAEETAPSEETALAPETALATTMPKETPAGEAGKTEINFNGRAKIRNLAGHDINQHYETRDE